MESIGFALFEFAKIIALVGIILAITNLGDKFKS